MEKIKKTNINDSPALQELEKRRRLDTVIIGLGRAAVLAGTIFVGKELIDNPSVLRGDPNSIIVGAATGAVGAVASTMAEIRRNQADIQIENNDPSGDTLPKYDNHNILPRI